MTYNLNIIIDDGSDGINTARDMEFWWQCLLSGLAKGENDDDDVQDMVVGPRANLFWGCHEPINDARDGLAHILCGRDDEAAGQQEDSGEDVVQPEHRVIRLNVLELEVIL